MGKRSQRYNSLEVFEEKFVRPKTGRTLIVGSKIFGSKPDRRLKYDDVVGVDMVDGAGVDVVLDLEDAGRDVLGTFDHVECMSVLEHSRRPWKLAANLVDMLVPDGTLFVTVPFVWRFHDYSGDYFRYTHQGVQALFEGVNWFEVMYAHTHLTRKTMMPAVDKEDYPYLARTEVCAFGCKA